MPRLFISHSSKDNVQALAFQNWLAANGWSREDVFVDLHSIGAGERWRDTLRKANASCEAVILLATPEALKSTECQKELELAEALGKEIVIALLRDLTNADPLLARYSERQFVDLSAEPRERLEPFEFEERVHRVEFSSQALAAIKARLDDLGIAPGTFQWPPKGAINPEPYPGLSAFGEDEAGIFFGRDADIMSALTEIRTVRRRRTPRLIVIDAASGAGKSSFLRAGLWPRLSRDPDFAPLAILRPAQGILTGPDGIGRRMAPYFQRHGTVKAPGTIHAMLATDDPDAGAMALAALLAEATALATTVRRAASADAKPPAALIAIDQGEEMFSAENEVETRRFLRQVATVLKAPPEGVDPYVLITIRADSVQSLLTHVAELGLETPKALYLPPLSRAAYRDVILKPAEIYAERVRRLSFEPALADALVEDAAGADALPLLAFTLSQMFANYGLEGQITLARYREMGGASGSIRRALNEALARVGPSGTPENLRRLFVPRLATWDPDADQQHGSAKRVVADIESVIGGDRASLVPLANALIAARLLTRSRDTLEVAHEALLRQPPISDWLEEDRGFLVWRDRLARERQSFEGNQRGMLAGRELQIAREWLRLRAPDDVVPADRAFIAASAAEDDKRRTAEETQERRRQEAELAAIKAREAAAQERLVASRRIVRRTVAGLIGALAFAAIAGAAGIFAMVQKREAEAHKTTAEGEKSKAEAFAQRAEAAEKEALRQRDVALQSRSRFLTGLAQDQYQRGNKTNATLLALEAIPAGKAGAEASYAEEARAIVQVGTNVDRVVKIGPQSSSAPRTAVFSPDGTRIVSLVDQEALLLDARTRAVLAKLTNPHDTIHEARFINGGRSVLTVTDDVVEEWDSESGRRLGILCAHGTALQAVVLSHSGKHLMTVGRDGMAQVWDTATGKLAGPPIIFDSLIAYRAKEKSSLRFGDEKKIETAGFAVSGDGRRVLTKNSSGQIALWDAQTGQIIAASQDKMSRRGETSDPSTPRAGPAVSAIGSLGEMSSYTLPSMSPDGLTFAIGNSENKIAIFSTETGALEFTSQEGHTDDVVILIFDRAGERILSAGHDHRVRIWRAVDGELLATLEGHESWVTEGEFSPDGAFAFTRGSSQTIVWDLRATPPVQLTTLSDNRGDGVGFTPDSRQLIILGGSEKDLSFVPLVDVKDDASTTGTATDNPARFGFQPGRLIAVDAPSGRVLFGDNKGVASMFDVDANEEVAQFTGHSASIDTALLSAKDKVLLTASSGGGGVWQWDLERAARTHRHPVAFAGHSTLKYSPDKRHFSMLLADSRIVLTKSGEAEKNIIGMYPDKLFSLEARSPAGNKLMLFSRIDGRALLLDIAAPDKLIELGRGSTGNLLRPRFSADGALLVAIREGVAMVWDAATGAALAQSRRVQGVTKLSFSPDSSRIAMISDEGVARVWTHATDTIYELTGHTKKVSIAVFSHDGSRIATGAADGVVRVWDVHSGKEITVFTGHDPNSNILSVSFSTDGERIATASSDKSARVWDARTGKGLAILLGHKDWVREAAFSPDGKTIVTGGDDNLARLWNAETGVETAVLKGHSDYVTQARFSADGQRILTSTGSVSRIWDAKTGALEKELKGATLEELEQKTLVAVSVEESIGIAALGSDALVSRLRGHTGGINSVNFSPDGVRAVTASADGTAKIWDVRSGKLLTTVGTGDGIIDHAIFLGDATRIATASSDFIVRVWNADDGREIAALKPFRKFIGSLELSPDGERLVVASFDQTARSWNPLTDEIVELRGHTDDVNFAAFAPDGRRIATASDDGSVRIWDAATGEEKQRLLLGRVAADRVTWREDGKRILVTTRTGLQSLDIVSQEKEFASTATTDILQRCLTQEQRARFYLAPDPPAWCVDAGKWPYNTADWQHLATTKPSGDNPNRPQQP